jgi:phage-related protein
MAGQSRTLKLSILADVDQLNKSLKAANNDVENSSSKMGDFGKKAGLAFAAAGVAAAAYAVKIGVDGVKAAIDDEAAQVRLATALKNATGATDDMIASVEKQITKTSLATGVADEKLRPALQRLSLSTNDVTKAQDLLNLSLDISQATGKSLDTVANALGKAYDGNATALGKLGVGLSAAELKAMSFTEVQSKLSDLFGGAASANAETFQGRIARLKVAFDESVETIGFALLPALQKFLDAITKYILPIVQQFSDAISSKSAGGLGTRIQQTVEVVQSFATPIFTGLAKLFGKVKDAIVDNKDAFESFFEVVKAIAPIIGKIIGTALSVIGDIAGVVIDLFAKVLSVIKPILDFAIDAVNQIIRGINLIKPGADIPSIKTNTSTSGTSTSISGVLGGSVPSVSVKVPTAPTITVPKVSTSGVAAVAASASSAAASSSSSGFAMGGGRSDSAASVNLTVNQGIVGDPEAAARSVVDVLNRSFFRGTNGANALVFG